MSNSRDKEEILIDQFSTVFTKDSPTDMPPSKQYKGYNLHHQHRSRVRKILEDISPSKASGPDEILNRVLKECAAQLAPGLTVIFQKSIDTGTLSPDWRNTNIASILRKEFVTLPSTIDLFRS